MLGVSKREDNNKGRKEKRGKATEKRNRFLTMIIRIPTEALRMYCDKS